jgi:hypothetical protein
MAMNIVSELSLSYLNGSLTRGRTQIEEEWLRKIQDDYK